jgi:TPP-dependent pyruvate/acetoin dehydrogenase alpha subunit
LGNAIVLSKDILLSLYESMVKQRTLEEKVIDLYKRGLVPGLAHPYIGQEAVAAGVCCALEKNDLVISNHRGHGHSLAKGVSEKAILSELMGKDAGMCFGIGGSMHSTDLDCGLVFSTAIVGGGIPLSVGIGLALKKSKKRNCVICFFGDGASNTGAFHESLNMAAVWRLPVIFVCENNQYAISVPVSNSMSAPVSRRGAAYGISSPLVDGMNVLEVYSSASQAITRAKQGEGPTLLECETYRYKGHGAYDTGLDYRTQDEVDKWLARDPIQSLENKLLAEELASPEEIEAIRKKTGASIEEAARFALERPYPSKDLLTKFVWG